MLLEGSLVSEGKSGEKSFRPQFQSDLISSPLSEQLSKSWQ